VESVVKSFKEQLRSGAWQNAQYTFRFIADLVNCHIVSATSLLQLYDTFMEGAMDTSVPQVGKKLFPALSLLLGQDKFGIQILL